jgi:hypothetical protein
MGGIGQHGQNGARVLAGLEGVGGLKKAIEIAMRRELPCCAASCAAESLPGSLASPSSRRMRLRSAMAVSNGIS